MKKTRDVWALQRARRKKDRRALRARKRLQLAAVHVIDGAIDGLTKAGDRVLLRGVW